MPVIIDGTLGVNASAITTTNWTPTNIATGGNTTLGDASGDTVTINAGTTTIASVGARIKADFSNSTLSNRVAFQTSAVNNNTAIIALPSGTNTISSFRAMSSSDADNAAQATLRIDGSEVQLRADTSGTASYLPITFYTSGLERMRLNTGGGVNISGGALFIGASGGEGGEIQLSGAAGGNSFMIDVGPSDIVRLIQNANQPIQFHTNSLERMRIDASGNVGIGGLGTINGKFSVLTSGSFNSVGDSTTTGVNIVGPNYNFGTGSNPALFNVESNDSIGADVGATIGLGGKYNASQKAQFAIIKGAKENATNDNYATYLAFGTRSNGSNIQERMRISSDGKVGIGTVSPAAKLHVVATGTANLASATISNVTDFAQVARVGFDGLTNNNDGIFFGTGVNGGIASGLGFFRENVGWNSAIAFYTNNVTDGINVSKMQEKMRISSDGKIGIGTTAPGSRLDVNGDINISNSYLHLSGDYTSIHFVSGTAGDLYMDCEPGTRVVRLRNWNGSSPNWAVTGMQAGVFKPFYGVQFPAAQNASGDPNTLDDYEEGDWTPAFATNATQPTGVTYDTSLTKGRYTKIGRIVHVRGTIVMTSKGTGGTGNPYITMPFASANYGGYAYQAFPTFMYYSGGLPRTMYLAVYDQNSTAYLATNADAASVVDWSVLSNNEKFSFSGTYQV